MHPGETGRNLLEAKTAITPAGTKSEAKTDGVELWTEVCSITRRRNPYQEGWKSKNWKADKKEVLKVTKSLLTGQGIPNKN